jgi:hypothetical protein
MSCNNPRRNLLHMAIQNRTRSRGQKISANKLLTSNTASSIQFPTHFDLPCLCVPLQQLYQYKKPYPTTNLHTNTPHRTNKNHMQANPTLKQHALKSKSQPIKITFAANVCFFVSETHLSETKKLSLCADKQISEGKVGGPLMTRETKRPAPPPPPRKTPVLMQTRDGGKKKALNPLFVQDQIIKKQGDKKENFAKSISQRTTHMPRHALSRVRHTPIMYSRNTHAQSPHRTSISLLSNSSHQITTSIFSSLSLSHLPPVLCLPIRLKKSMTRFELPELPCLPPSPS